MWHLAASPRSRVTVPPRHLVYLSTCLLIALALGALGVINTWDLPTYALLVVGACVVAGWRARRWLGAAGGALLAVLISVLAVAAYWPFYAHYETQVGQGAGSLVGRFLGWVRAGSPLDDWLVIWGFFLLLAVCYVVVVWRRSEQGSRGADEQRDGVVITAEGGNFQNEAVAAEDRVTFGAGAPVSRAATGEDNLTAEDVETAEEITPFASSANSAVNLSEYAGEGPEPGDQRLTTTLAGKGSPDSSVGIHSPSPPYNRRRLIALLGLLGFVALLAGVGRPTAAIAALPLCLALPLAFRRKASAGEATVALLLALGLSIIAGTELIYLRDFLAGGDWYRMNTLFKFSVPAWLFLALAGGVMLPIVWAAAGRARLDRGADSRRAGGDVGRRAGLPGGRCPGPRG